MIPRRRWSLAAAVVVAGAGAALVIVGTSGIGEPPFRAVGAAPQPAAPQPAAPQPAAPQPAAPQPAAPQPAAPQPATRQQAAPVAFGRARPVGLDVPSIGLRTPVGDVGITADHRIDVPAARAGLPAYWYRLLASPGEAGTAVLVGHVDSAADGPGVFYRIGELGAGDVVTVHRDDGTAPSFVVVRVARFAKDRFPTDVVYGATGRPTLRLVTCGGSFDRSTGSYRDNVVVFADLTEPRRDRFGPPLPAPR